MAVRKKLIVIGGPTAVGKTGAAIELARQLGTEIISADSRQCYKELNIGVARPTEEQLRMVPHHFIASHSIHEKITAADFENYGLEKAAALFKSHHTIVLAGGTGLYIKAFCEGLDAIPSIPESLRQEIIDQYDTHGLGWLRDEVRSADPGFFEAGEIQNPHRLIRALEVVRFTGQSILRFRKGKPAERSFDVEKIALELPREELYRNIGLRVEFMLEQGLVEEVKSLHPYRHLNALNTVGYKEIFGYLDGILSLDEAAEAIKKNTRQYAKRQMTWFRKDPAYRWIRATDFDPAHWRTGQ